MPRSRQIPKVMSLEVMYDLTWNLAREDAWESIGADSRERFSLLLGWTQEFERVYRHTDWDKVDYLETVDNFYDGKMLEMGRRQPEDMPVGREVEGINPYDNPKR